jgi:hypothetical protein
MKVTVIKTENHKTYLTVEAEQADMKISMDKTNKRSEKKVEISSDKVNAPKYAMEEKIERITQLQKKLKKWFLHYAKRLLMNRSLRQKCSLY